MKTILIFCSFFILSISQQVRAQEPVDFTEFNKFILKNYRVLKQHRSECSFNYTSVVVQVDTANKVINLQFNKEISDDMKSSFNFIKGFQFSKSYNINERSILFFLVIDQQEICPVIYESGQTPQLVLRQGLNSIREQLQKDPKTIILYEPLIVKVFKTSHGTPPLYKTN